jgi:hypothetical protein
MDSLNSVQVVLRSFGEPSIRYPRGLGLFVNLYEIFSLWIFISRY